MLPHARSQPAIPAADDAARIEATRQTLLQKYPSNGYSDKIYAKCIKILQNVATCEHLTQLLQNVWDLCPFCENPVCPNPVWKPVINISCTPDLFPSLAT